MVFKKGHKYYSLSPEKNKIRIEKIKETKRKNKDKISEHSKKIWSNYTKGEKTKRLKKELNCTFLRIRDCAEAI